MLSSYLLLLLWLLVRFHVREQEEDYEDEEAEHHEEHGCVEGVSPR